MCSRKLRGGLTQQTLNRRVAGLAPIISRRGSLTSRDTRACPMTKVRFEPAFLDDPRWERLGADCYILHTTACGYVVHTLSDGFISEARALSLTPLVRAPKRAVKALVDDGIWRAVAGGFVVCECVDDLRVGGRGDEQPSRLFVESERERNRQRTEKWRRNRVGNGVTNGGGNRVGNGVSNRDGGVGVGVVEEPTVPVPPLLADDDPEAVCEHGTPGGSLPTRSGAPRCPMCRNLSLVGDSA